MNIQTLKNRKTKFYDQIWKDFNQLRKEVHIKITDAKKEIKSTQQKINKTFIEAAINNAGEPQLSDQLILDKVSYDSFRKIWIVMPEAHGIIPPQIKNFHAIAMLRNPEHFKDNSIYNRDLLKIAGIALKTKPTTADNDLLNALEDELNEMDDFKDELKAKDYEFTTTHHYKDPRFLSMEEMRDHITRNYPETPLSSMTAEQALEILAQQENGATHNHLSSEEMRDHTARQYGKMDCYGPNGKTVIPA